MRLSRPSSSWRLLLLSLLVLAFLLSGSMISYGLDQTELLNELSQISSELNTSQSYIEQGLEKVENSLNLLEEKSLSLDERLQKVEKQLQQASQELKTSEQDSATFIQQVADLQNSFDNYRKKKDRESKLLKLGLGAALLAIVVESIALAIK